MIIIILTCMQLYISIYNIDYYNYIFPTYIYNTYINKTYMLYTTAPPFEKWPSRHFLFQFFALAA